MSGSTSSHTTSSARTSTSTRRVAQGAAAAGAPVEGAAGLDRAAVGSAEHEALLQANKEAFTKAGLLANPNPAIRPAVQLATAVRNLSESRAVQIGLGAGVVAFSGGWAANKVFGGI